MSKNSDSVPEEEVCDRLGIGRNGYFNGMHDGTIPCIRVGRRLIVPRIAFEELLRNPPGSGGVQPMPPRKKARRK